MKFRILKVSFILLLMTGSISLAWAWGRWGHKHISRAAVFALPPAMQIFFYNHIDFLTEDAVVPDLRKYLTNDKNEPPRHFIDIEEFGKIPLDSLPRTSHEAFEKYGSKFLNKTGYLPWYIQDITQKLTEAFRKRDKSEILFLASDLSHYIADAHQPLHTTSNYDGQLSDQKGVHSLWESVLPQEFGSSYDFRTEPARYIPDITDETWKIIAHSHSLVDTVLAADLKVRKNFTTENMYKRDTNGDIVKFYNSPVFSDAYARQFNDALNGMVQRQLRLSIYEVSSFWYTAWVNAGKPDLTSLDDPHLTKQNRKNFRSEKKAWEKGKILNLSKEGE